MSVTTTADERLEKTKESTQAAIEELSEIVVHRCSGHDEYNAAYNERMREALQLLLQVRDNLEGGNAPAWKVSGRKLFEE